TGGRVPLLCGDPAPGRARKGGASEFHAWFARVPKMICPPAMTVSDVPSVVGRLPTITKPLFKTPKAVVSPTLARSDGAWKKTDVCPLGVTRTMVLPVPWRLAALLKLETRISPGLSGPPGAN